MINDNGIPNIIPPANPRGPVKKIPKSGPGFASGRNIIGPIKPAINDTRLIIAPIIRLMVIIRLCREEFPKIVSHKLRTKKEMNGERNAYLNESGLS
jgi:hypothetical protein